MDTRARSLEKLVASRDDQIKGFQRDIRRNENATKVLVREKELLVVKLKEAHVKFEEELKAREAAFSDRLAETTAGFEQGQNRLEDLEREKLEWERERGDLITTKVEGALKIAKLEERVKLLAEALEKSQGELKVRRGKVSVSCFVKHWSRLVLSRNALLRCLFSKVVSTCPALFRGGFFSG